MKLKIVNHSLSDVVLKHVEPIETSKAFVYSDAQGCTTSKNQVELKPGMFFWQLESASLPRDLIFHTLESGLYIPHVL